MTTLGFVVLAKRPNPTGDGPPVYEPVSAVFPEPPENALESCQKRPVDPLDPVEYVIGAITLADLTKPEDI